jgi:hypothetical protein
MVKSINEDGGQSTSTYWNSKNNTNNAKFFKVSGYISRMMNDEKMFYLSCPECRKKVIEETVGYRCENCNKI